MFRQVPYQEAVRGLGIQKKQLQGLHVDLRCGDSSGGIALWSIVARWIPPINEVSGWSQRQSAFTCARDIGGLGPR